MSVTGHMDRSIRIGEVFMVRFDGGIGNVQSGLRPAVVFQNNIGNRRSPNVVVLPLTTNLRRSDMPTHVILPARETGLAKDSMVLCENPVCIPRDRLGAKLTALSDANIGRIAIASIMASGAISFLNRDALTEVWRSASALNAVASRSEVI